MAGELKLDNLEMSQPKPFHEFITPYKWTKRKCHEQSELQELMELLEDLSNLILKKDGTKVKVW